MSGDLWDVRRPTESMGQVRETSPAMVQAVFEGQTDVNAIDHSQPATQAAWLIDHLDEAVALLTQRTTWKAIDGLDRQFMRERFGVELLVGRRRWCKQLTDWLGSGQSR